MADNIVVDYASLKAHIRDTLNRRDLEAETPVFVRMCENDMNRRIKARQMETFAIISTINDELALPSDFRNLRNIELVDFPGPLTPVQSNALDGLADKSGTPTCYTIQGNSILFYPNPGTGVNVALRYTTGLELTDVSPANWVLDRHQDAYVYGALVHSAPYLKDDKRIALWKGLYDQAIEQINMEAANIIEFPQPQLSPVEGIA